MDYSMEYSASTDGFRIAYRREGKGGPVLLIHGSPGDHNEYSKVIPLLADSADVIAPDLRGFGKSDKHRSAAEAYSRDGQARAMIALLEELHLTNVVVCGYDIGAFTAQTVARMRPDLVKSLVLCPPVPGAGTRMLDNAALREFWHATLYQTELVERMIDGNPSIIRSILNYNLEHWSGPGYRFDEGFLDHMVEIYSAPGAFIAGISWFRHKTGNPIVASATEQTPSREARLKKPVSILWPENDPLFPTAWSDRLGDFFADYSLQFIKGVGHFTPVEAPEIFARAVIELLKRP
jgi:pimeloyl-ACP methyl ester carboxylesterase